VIREEEGVPVRIDDVAELELGSESYQVVARYTAKDVVGVGIVRQSTSNELAVSEAVHAALPEINRSLPEGVEVSLAVDFTIFVREAIRQVSFTLMIAFAAVVLVNLLFLHSPTTTAITTVAIPTSLIGTFAVLEVLGFSINILTLLALVLSIGLLVDDAIVVTENIFRRQEQGESRREAALLGAREVGFPVIATTVAVVAVLIPLSLMSGDIGRLFREFALTMAICVTISTFVALTAVPMFCSRFLDVTRQPGIVGAAVDRRMDSMRHGYGRILGLALHHRGIVGALFLMLLVLTGLLYRGLDQTFLPVEDRGRIFVLIRAPQGSTTAYTQRALTQVEEKLLATPEIAGFFAAIGMGFGTPASSSLGMVFIRMQHWDDRERKQQEVVAELFPAFMDIPEAHVYAINPPSLSRRSNRDVEVVIKSSSAELEKMREITEAIVGRMQELPGLVNVESDLRLENPQLDIVFDREHGADVGVPVRAVSESLRLLLSQGPADDFILRNKQYNVVMALASPFRSVPEQLGEVHVRGREGAMLPLSSLIDARPRIGPAKLNHYDLQRSATISANLAQDAALGSALSQVEAIFDELLPAGFTRSLRGTSREFVESANEVFFTFGLALLVIYLVLAAQFESFVHPLTILVTVPLASLGALGALHISHNTLNLYSQIGIILLVGLVTKNGILIVDFANRARARGVSLERSLLDAGRIRFRPILMTSVTSIMGALPLALAGGAGAESRQALGVAVVGGLIVATIFTLVVVPVAHYVLVRGTEALGWSAPPRTLEGA
jgi:multidrug efflux pump